MGVTHLLSLQPAADKNSAPFRLPQNHMLFGSLSETVTKGELRSAEVWRRWGWAARPPVLSLVRVGTLLPLLIRLCPAKQSLDPLHGGSCNTHLPTGRRGRGDLCWHPACVQPASSGEAAGGWWAESWWGRKADEGKLYLWFPVLLWVAWSNCRRTELRVWWRCWHGRAHVLWRSLECGDRLYNETWH